MSASATAAAAGRGRASALLLLTLFAASVGAIKIGPKPTAPPGVIVRYKSGRGGVQPAVAALRPGSAGAASQALDPSLNLYRVPAPVGQTPAQAAAALARSSEVEYACADAYVHIAGGIVSEEQPQGHSHTGRRQQQKTDSSSSSRALGRRVTAAPAPSRRPPPPPLVQRAPVVHPLRPPPPKWVQRAAVSPPPPRPPLPRPPPPSPAPAFVPDDPLYKEQWALGALRAPQAWALAKADSSSVLTCVVDTGVKWDHLDLAANLVAASPEYKAAHSDDNGHGTHVAGIIGAVGNNGRGVVGASPHARILPCKALDANGWGLISKVIECISLCRSRGARVINTSFVMSDLSRPLMEAVANASRAGIFISAAAGNWGDNTDEHPYYPGSFAFPGVVAVANVAQGDVLAYSSNFGGRTVDLAAPGSDILSTWIAPDFQKGYYTKLTGTSMAAQYVSGAAALAIAISGGTLSNAQVAQLLSSSSRPVAALRGQVASGGVVNLQQLLRMVLAAKAKARAKAAKAKAAGSLLEWAVVRLLGSCRPQARRACNSNSTAACSLADVLNMPRFVVFCQPQE